MIQLPDTPLPANIRTALQTLQAKVNTKVEYAEQVGEAKRLFSQSNVSSNPTFAEVRRILIEMCTGLQRCVYCEDSWADEVEHIKPKNLYPEETFVWENYVLACGPCNGKKSDHFAIFSSTTGECLDVSRPRNAPVKPPAPGEPVLINPRQERALDLIELDIMGTFLFLPRRGLSARDSQRAKYTIDSLQLNKREHLRYARQGVYVAYGAILREYLQRRDAGATSEELAHKVQAIKRMPHRTVWEEMKQQYRNIPELNELFLQIPEALLW